MITKKTLLWLDDYRNPLEEDGKWLVFSPIQDYTEVVWVKSYNEFVDWITKNGLPSAICFDHDLTVYQLLCNCQPKELLEELDGIDKIDMDELQSQSEPNYYTGRDCANWLIGYCICNDLDLPPYNMQSANSEGKKNIDELLKNYIKHRSSKKPF